MFRFGFTFRRRQIRISHALQSFQHKALQLYEAAASFAFRIFESPDGPRSLDCPTHARRAPLPLDIVPLQGQILAWSHSGGQGQGKQPEPVGFYCDGEEPPAFLNAESFHFPSPHAGKIHAHTWIFEKHFPAHGLAEGRLQNRIRVRNRSRRQATL